MNWVWNAQWQFDGDTLTLTPGSGGDVIEPGQSVSVNFSAQGATTSPTSCTFNGAACTQNSAGPLPARARHAAPLARPASPLHPGS